VKLIKVRIGKYLNSVNGIYLDPATLQSLVQSYNQTFHSTIKATPESVHFGGKRDISAARSNIKKRAVRVVNKTVGVFPPLAVGDHVRVHNRVSSEWLRYTKLKKKVYLEQWSDDLFTVRLITRPKPGLSSHYYLSIDGKGLPYAFIRQDLQKVDQANLQPSLAPGHYVVSEVKDKKVEAGRTKYLVTWAGYKPSETTWVDPSPGFARKIAEFEASRGRSRAAPSK
jgi:hypothetical protein